MRNLTKENRLCKPCESEELHATHEMISAKITICCQRSWHCYNEPDTKMLQHAWLRFGRLSLVVLLMLVTVNWDAQKLQSLRPYWTFWGPTMVCSRITALARFNMLSLSYIMKSMPASKNRWTEFRSTLDNLIQSWSCLWILTQADSARAILSRFGTMPLLENLFVKVSKFQEKN